MIRVLVIFSLITFAITAKASDFSVNVALSAVTAAGNGNKSAVTTAVREFYEAREFAPVWVGEAGINAQGIRLLETLGNADAIGLNSAAYGVVPPKTGSAQDLAKFERALTLAAIRFAQHLSAGQVTAAQMRAGYQNAAKPIDPALFLTMIDTGAEPSAVFDAIGPSDAAYRQLVAAYNDLRTAVAAGGWTRVDAGPTIWPGDMGPRVVQLRRALAERGDYSARYVADATVYDVALADAVKRFQSRHGLAEDGAVGRGTRAALNVSATERLAQIRVNLDRRRWLNNPDAERRIDVNLPAYTLAVIDGEDVTYTSRVVVGSRRHQTPEFSADLSYLVVNPYWYVPSRIASQELLPKLREDPYALAAKGFKAFTSWDSNGVQVDWGSVDWASMDRMPFYLRQDSGAGNALGEIKFMLPNHHNIYLHDTPAKRLFARSMRAFSHGCIRLADPRGLAAHLLADQQGWDRQGIARRIAGGKRRTVTLGAEVPVRMLYHTAWVDEAGTLHLRADVYGRDRQMARLLEPRV